jgi:nitrogen regulatory protein P-II 1
MKLIIAIIRPEKLNVVREALSMSEVHLMTVTDVRGCGVQGGRQEVYRGQEHSVELLPKVKIEIAVNDTFVDATVDAIVQNARTEGSGKIGDGKIFILPMEDCVRIRTGEQGVAAIGP